MSEAPKPQVLSSQEEVMQAYAVQQAELAQNDLGVPVTPEEWLAGQIGDVAKQAREAGFGSPATAIPKMAAAEPQPAQPRRGEPLETIVTSRPARTEQLQALPDNFEERYDAIDAMDNREVNMNLMRAARASRAAFLSGDTEQAAIQKGIAHELQDTLFNRQNFDPTANIVEQVDARARAMQALDAYMLGGDQDDAESEPIAPPSDIIDVASKAVEVPADATQVMPVVQEPQKIRLDHRLAAWATNPEAKGFRKGVAALALGVLAVGVGVAAYRIIRDPSHLPFVGGGNGKHEAAKMIDRPPAPKGGSGLRGEAINGRGANTPTSMSGNTIQGGGTDNTLSLDGSTIQGNGSEVVTKDWLANPAEAVKAFKDHDATAEEIKKVFAHPKAANQFFNWVENWRNQHPGISDAQLIDDFKKGAGIA